MLIVGSHLINDAFTRQGIDPSVVVGASEAFDAGRALALILMIPVRNEDAMKSNSSTEIGLIVGGVICVVMAGQLAFTSPMLGLMFVLLAAVAAAAVLYVKRRPG